MASPTSGAASAGRANGARARARVLVEVLGADPLDELVELGHQLFAFARFVDVLALGDDDPFGVEQCLFGIDGGARPNGQGDSIDGRADTT